MSLLAGDAGLGLGLHVGERLLLAENDHGRMEDGRGWCMVHDQPSMKGPDSGRFESDPVIEAYKKDVDRTLIREQLRRSVEERVGNMIAALQFAEALREARRRSSQTS